MTIITEPDDDLDEPLGTRPDSCNMEDGCESCQ